MPAFIVTRARRGPVRRRLALVNRVEDQLPGRAAFVMNLTRIRVAQLRTNDPDDSNNAKSSSTPAEATRATTGVDAKDGRGEPRRVGGIYPHTGEVAANEATGSGRAASGTTTADTTTVSDDQPADDPEAHEQPSAYEEWTKGELYDRARELDLHGRSKLNKKELIEALKAHDA